MNSVCSNFSLIQGVFVGFEKPKHDLNSTIGPSMGFLNFVREFHFLAAKNSLSSLSNMNLSRNNHLQY